MRLDENPFQRTESGIKTLELRLFDEKRRRIGLGDSITFVHKDTSKQLLTSVQGLLIYPTFRDLISEVGLQYIGKPAGTTEEAYVQEMLQDYSIEKQTKLGVIGIKFQIF